MKARRTSFITHATRWIQRHWKIAAAAAVAAVVTAVLAFFVAAPLFDKPFDELVAWRDEEMASGNPDVAAQVFMRALKDASDAEKMLVVDRIARTCRSMDDPKTRVELAMRVIEVAPAESFGQHDYLVAKALVAREHAATNLGTINVWNSKSEPVLELIRSRLERALESNLPEDQELEIEEILTNVKLAIADGAYPIRYHPDYLHQLPKGDVDELRQILRNESTDPWSRARAGTALGKIYQDEGHVARFFPKVQRNHGTVLLTQVLSKPPSLLRGERTAAGDCVTVSPHSSAFDARTL